MSVIYIVLPMALVFAGFFVVAFIWAVRHGQLDDLETPAARMLFDDDLPAPGEKATGGDAARADASTQRKG